VWDLTKNKSICVYPYVHKHHNLDENEGFCCFTNENYGRIGQDNTAGRQEVIDTMQKGLPVKGCDICYTKESEGHISPRIEKTKQWIERYGEPEQVKFQWFDIRNDDTCNLKCKYCGPWSSSLWKKELNIPVTRKKQIEITDDEIAQCHSWYQAGGEPFLNQPFLDIILRFAEINPSAEITINTNLSNVSNKWLEALSKLTNLTITASIDASGKLLQYLRYPVTEQRITETMNKIYDNTDATILAGCTASNLSIHAFDKTYEYFKQNLKDITQLDMGIVTEPEEFTVDAIPESIRHVYIETTEKVIAQIKADSKSIRKLMMIDRLENVIHRLKNQKYKKQLHLKLQNTIETQDSKRNLKLIDVDPFLHDWIYNKYTA
tara:strand:- start:275 stop:1405 length:1131 start_codon:yes stop_codon:yes gene_type:complete